MITDLQHLRDVYGEPSQRVLDKELNHLDRHCLRFLELSPFCFVATSDGTTLDVSPKGDQPGFAQAEGSAAVLLPDWPGNKRLDGYRNVLKNPHVGLIFLIPGLRETLRVNGPATIHEEPEILAPFEHKGRLPITVMRVEAREVYLHCAKAFLRSGLWDADTWPEKAALPKPGEMFKDHLRLDGPAQSTEEIHGALSKTLY
ncbi:pyridoxamine 5'-phosphate oxidase family protein [uncultured Albimonas sp.]|mgnify:CR=1 FL=1|uniref:pyridoxamine 5'-phosphate oxidase family protein n=1 Tax=uncultured Albimonas sp. TaxID=1331701 RepID=UPI0030EB3830|tara:strand:+ start:3705 stop:4307 length:603 start_codon:yes stop_codon:yes gene_type:complete